MIFVSYNSITYIAHPSASAQVVAKRYQRDGVLQLDDHEEASGQAPGTLKSLDLRGPTYLGYVPTNEKRYVDDRFASK